MTKWTKMQDLALSSSGNLLISASAGSGKTSVMVQKVIDYLFSNKDADISKLVVITFTNASADEMKQKLADKLYERLRASDNLQERERIRKQINSIPQSNISTIDSYCADILKRYFEVIDKDPMVSVMEQSEANYMFAQAREEVLERYLDTQDTDFAELVEKFTARRDIDMLRKALDDLHKFLAVQADGKAFIIKALAHIEESMDTSPTALYLLSHYRKKSGALIRICEQQLGLLNKFVNDGKIFAKFFDTLCKYRDALLDISNVADLQGIYTLAGAMGKAPSSPQLRQTPPEPGASIIADVKKTFGTARAFLKEVSENFAEGYQVAQSAETEARIGVSKLFEISLEVETRYRKAKDKERRADYADIEHYALKILDNPAIADEVKADIDYVFIDEYQDTNYLQESIIARISKDNVFMVGDVKQSIYKFRFAEPRIFLDKRKRFDATQEGTNISFNENFRSTEGVIDFINLIFDEIMTYDFGGIEYRKDARLKFGPDEKIKKVNNFADAEIALFTEEKSESPQYPQIYSVKKAPKHTVNPSYEALYIADKISAMVGKAQIYDAETKKTRLCRYGDIAILFRVKKGGDIIAELKNRNIPFTAENFRDHGDTSAIDLLIDFARVLDNPRQDIPLVAVMQSYLGKFSDNELLEIRSKHQKGAFWEAVYSYSGNQNVENKLNALLALIDKYRRLACFADVRELFDSLVAETGYDGYLLSQGEAHIKRLNAFIFSLTGSESRSSIRRFLDYCATVGEDDSSMPAEDCVTLSSIHGAKGLEYPIVFIARADSPIRNHTGGEVLSDDTGGGGKRVFGDMIYLDTELGVALKHVDEDSAKSETFSTKALKIKLENDKKEEMVRLLYVAMTRARQHLFISGKSAKADFVFADEPNSFAGWINFACGHNPALAKYYTQPIIPSAPIIGEKTKYVPLSASPVALKREYAHADAQGLSCKYSVSTLNMMAASADTEAPPAAALSFDGGHARGSIELGIAYHTILQHVDFGGTQDIDRLIDRLLQTKTLTALPEDFDKEVVAKAIANPYFGELAKAKCYKEQPFMLYVPAKYVTDSLSQDKILVQGVIDFISVGAENVIVDYKYTSAPDDIVASRYRKQLDIYAMAAERALKIKIDKRLIYLIGRDKFISL